MIFDKPEIVRVYGTADSFRLELIKDEGDRWIVTGLPPDLEDGTYACEFCAVTEYGTVGYWTGFLYMLQGKLTLELSVREPFTIRFLPSRTNIVFRCGHKEDGYG